MPNNCWLCGTSASAKKLEAKDFAVLEGPSYNKSLGIAWECCLKIVPVLNVLGIRVVVVEPSCRWKGSVLATNQGIVAGICRLSCNVCTEIFVHHGGVQAKGLKFLKLFIGEGDVDVVADSCAPLIVFQSGEGIEDSVGIAVGVNANDLVASIVDDFSRDDTGQCQREEREEAESGHGCFRLANPVN